MKPLIRVLGIFAILVFGLLAFQNALALAFSPSGGAGVTGVLAVLFGICALGGIGLVLVQGWGRWLVGGGSAFVIVSQMVAGRLLMSGNHHPILLDLLKHVSLQDLVTAFNLPIVLMMVAGLFHWVALGVAIGWRWMKK